MKTHWWLVSILVILMLMFPSPSVREALGSTSIRLVVNGRDLAVSPRPFISMPENTVLVPLRAFGEAIGARVEWEEDTRTVSVYGPCECGDEYLRGVWALDGQEAGIAMNIITAADLMAKLDDDNDGMLCDYREGGGDRIADDPLIVDVRDRTDYEAGHIPSAIWIADAAHMGQKENEAVLRRLLAQHVAGGGKEEIVVYCYTGHTSGLVTGVLGARGLPVRNLMYGFDIGWTGSRPVPPAIAGPLESLPDTPVEPGCG